MADVTRWVEASGVLIGWALSKSLSTFIFKDFSRFSRFLRFYSRSQFYSRRCRKRYKSRHLPTLYETATMAVSGSGRFRTLDVSNVSIRIF